MLGLFHYFFPQERQPIITREDYPNSGFNRWTDLYPGLLQQIFTHLSKEERIRSILVCRKWREILSSESVIQKSLIDVRTVSELQGIIEKRSHSRDRRINIFTDACRNYRTFRFIVEYILDGWANYHSLPELDMSDLQPFRERLIIKRGYRHRDDLYWARRIDDVRELIDVSDLHNPITKLKLSDGTPCIVFKHFNSQNKDKITLGLLIMNNSDPLYLGSWNLYFNDCDLPGTFLVDSDSFTSDLDRPFLAVKELFSRPPLTLNQFVSNDPSMKLTSMNYHRPDNTVIEVTMALAADNLA